MKRFNVLYVGLMSVLVVFGVRGMKDPNASLLESRIFSEEETAPLSPQNNPLEQSSFQQGFFSNGSNNPPTPPNQPIRENKSSQPLEVLRDLSHQWIELNKPTADISSGVNIQSTENNIRNILRSEAGQIINQLQTNEFIKSVENIINSSPSITKEAMIPFKAGLDTIYYSSNPKMLCPDLVKSIPLIYNKTTRQLDSDLVDSTRNLLTIFNTIKKNQKENQKIFSFLEDRLNGLSKHEQNPNKIASILYTMSSLIQVLCGENILTIADAVKKNNNLSISAKIVILKALQKLPSALITKDQSNHIANQVKSLQRRKSILSLEKKLQESKALLKPEAEHNLKNLIEYKNTLEQYINLIPAGFVETEIQETLTNVSNRIDFLIKNSNATTTSKGNISLPERQPSKNPEGGAISQIPQPIKSSKESDTLIKKTIELIKNDVDGPLFKDDQVSESANNVINNIIALAENIKSTGDVSNENLVAIKELMDQSLLQQLVNPQELIQLIQGITGKTPKYVEFKNAINTINQALSTLENPMEQQPQSGNALSESFVPAEAPQILEDFLKSEIISSGSFGTTETPIIPATVAPFVEEIELLPELQLGKTPDLVNILSAINKLMPEDDKTVSGSALSNAAQSGNMNYKLLVNNQHQYKSVEVKGLKQEIVKRILKTIESIENKSFMCGTIPFLLNQIYEQQKNPDTVTSLESAKHDFLLCLNALPEVVGNFKTINKHLIETIVFNGALNKEKIQACLILLGSQCNQFYTQLNGSTTVKELQNVRIFYNNSPKKAETSNSVVRAITLLASLEPVFSDKLPSDITIDQLKIYEKRLEDYKKLIKDQSNASTALEKIKKLIQTKEQEEKLGQSENIVEPEFITPVEPIIPQTPTKEQIETMTTDKYRKTANAFITKDYSSSSLENLRESLDVLHAIRNSERVNDLDSKLENTITTVEAMIIDHYRKIANELIAKDYSSFSLKNLQESLQEISVIKNSNELDDLDSELENTMTSINKLSKKLIDKTILNADNLIFFDHFYNLALVIKNLKSNIHNDTDNEIFQSYSDKLSNDLKVLIDQIKSKRGEFKDLNEKSEVEGMIQVYLHLGLDPDQDEILKPYLDKVLQEIFAAKATATPISPSSVQIQPTIEISKQRAETPSANATPPAIVNMAPAPVEKQTPPAARIPVALQPGAETALQLSQPEKPQILPEIVEEQIQMPTQENLAQLSNQELVNNINGLALPILSKEKKINDETFNIILAYADQLIKNEPTIQNNVIATDHFTNIAKTIELLRKLTDVFPKEKIHSRIMNLINNIGNRDKEILINKIKEDLLRFKPTEMNDLADRVSRQYFPSYADNHSQPLYKIKKDVIDEIQKMIPQNTEAASNIPPVQAITSVTPPASLIQKEADISYKTPTPPAISTPKKGPLTPPTEEDLEQEVIIPQQPTPTTPATEEPAPQPGFFSRAWNAIASRWNNFWSYIGSIGYIN